MAAAAFFGAWARRNGHATPELELLVALLFVVAGFVATERLTPYLATIRAMPDRETVSFPLYALYRRRNERSSHSEDI